MVPTQVLEEILVYTHAYILKYVYMYSKFTFTHNFARSSSTVTPPSREQFIHTNLFGTVLFNNSKLNTQGICTYIYIIAELSFSSHPHTNEPPPPPPCHPQPQPTSLLLFLYLKYSSYIHNFKFTHLLPPSITQSINHSLTSLPSRRAEERPIVGQRLGDGRALGVQVREGHRVAPPVREGGAAEAERERDDDDAEGGADVEGAGEDVVVTTCFFFDVSARCVLFYFVCIYEFVKEGGGEFHMGGFFFQQEGPSL